MKENKMKENNWSYLDKFDGNLIFVYMQSLTAKRSLFINPYSVNETGDEERDEFNKAELKRKTAFYLYWYVFRYVLECDSLEKAIAYANEYNLKKYKLYSFMSTKNNAKKRGDFYIGIYNEEIYLYKLEEIKIILEILYNRYDFFEQLECFLRNSSTKRGVSRNRCKKTLEKSKEFLAKRSSLS